ncbi:hypothetical protein [Oleiphilus messinensis]|uniref:hypothetical protein n=1 Tax=Oleiphilus messinensis TaxID=141451 RepID=UPI0018DF1A0D|nr:hypothetical protein [Oleiphilus messinensis]
MSAAFFLGRYRGIHDVPSFQIKCSMYSMSLGWRIGKSLRLMINSLDEVSGSNCKNKASAIT